MIHYLIAADKRIWRWADEPFPGRLEPVQGLPPGEDVSGRLIDHQTHFDIRLDSKPKMPIIKPE